MAAGLTSENPFEYATLEDPSKQIRIVYLRPQLTLQDKPQCRIEVATLLDKPKNRSQVFTRKPKPKYTALSYTWGDPQNRSPILIDGRTLEVTQNLLHFLQQAACDLREEKASEKAYWIDAICINQQDDDEKGFQVGLMGEIYSRCSDLVIWLGTATDDSRDAIDFLRNLALAQTQVDSKRSGILQTRVGVSVQRRLRDFCKNEDTTVTALLNLAQRPWWRRVWVQQEVTLPNIHHSKLECGDALITWREVVLAHDALNSMLQYTVQQPWHLGDSLGIGLPPPDNITGVLQGLSWCFASMQPACRNSYPQVFGNARGRSSSLAHRLIWNDSTPQHRLEASNKLDYVYVMVGISRDVKIVPDYHKTKTVLYPEMAKHLLETIGPYDFGMCVSEEGRSSGEYVRLAGDNPGSGIGDRAIVNNQQHDESLPSWVPDLSKTTWRQNLSGQPREKGRIEQWLSTTTGLASRIPLEITGTRLELQAKIADTILPGNTLESVSSQHIQTHDDQSDVLRAWLLSYDRFLNNVLSNRRPELVDVWWRIPICNRRHIYIRGLWYKDERSSFNELMAQARAQAGIVDISRDAIRYRDRMSSIVRDRCAFITKSGRPGLGPSGMRAGDEIFVIVGGKVPLVLRPGEDGTYTLIGEAYVHELNCKRVLKQRDLPAQTIAIV